MDQHYRQALDEALPMLNDRTPRECAMDPDLQGKVVQWIKTLENQDSHAQSHDLSSSTEGYDFSWIWVELGLDKYRT